MEFIIKTFLGLSIDKELLQKVYNKIIGWSIENLPSIIFTFVLLFVILKAYKYLVNRIKGFILKRNAKSEDVDDLETSKRVNTLVGIITGAGKIIIWVVFLLILLKEFGIEIGPILAGAGILGLAIGFGAQELVRDFISGFFILLENQVRTGDVAVINGQAGLVEKIELRTITLRDFSGTVHIFQNGKISTMANMTKEWSAMVFDVRVAYKEDVDTVMEIMREVGEEMQEDESFKDKIIEPMEIFGLDQFADSAIIVKGRLKTRPIEQWGVGREYRRRLKKAFDEKGIEIPFPHTTVYWGEKINPLKLEIEEQLKNNKNG